MENLWHKKTDCTSFAKKFLQIICQQPVKGNLHIFNFLNHTSGYLKFCKLLCIFKMRFSRDFQNVYFIIFRSFFCKHFYIITRFWKKNQLLQICNFFAYSKSRAQEIFNNVSFVIFWHQTLDLEEGQIDPPLQHIPVFQYLSMDRVKKNTFNQWGSQSCSKSKA